MCFGILFRITEMHGFKNQTGPADRIVSQSRFQSGPVI